MDKSESHEDRRKQLWVDMFMVCMSSTRFNTYTCSDIATWVDGGLSEFDRRFGGDDGPGDPDGLGVQLEDALSRVEVRDRQITNLTKHLGQAKMLMETIAGEKRDLWERNAQLGTRADDLERKLSQAEEDRDCAEKWTESISGRNDELKIKLKELKGTIDSLEKNLAQTQFHRNKLIGRNKALVTERDISLKTERRGRIRLEEMASILESYGWKVTPPDDAEKEDETP